MATAFARARLRGSLPAFRHRNYRLYWFGQLVSMTGTWMQTVGQAWLVLVLSGSALALGTVSALQFTPMLLFGLWGGVIADRVPKRRLLLVTQSAAMCLAALFALLIVTQLIQVWQIMILALLLGGVNALDMPTRQAFVGELVPPEDLGSAIALNSSLFNAARLVGPGLAGLLIGWFGVGSVIWLNAASFLAVLLALSRIRVDAVRTLRLRGSINAQLLEGLRYVRATPQVSTILILIAVICTFGMNFNVLIPLFARGVLHRDAAGFGFLLSAMGAGALVAAIGLSFGGRAPRLGRVAAAGVAFSLLQIAFAASTFFPLSLTLLALTGCSMVLLMATANTIVQLGTPLELRGRVMSLYTTLVVGSTPLGSLVIGGLAHLYGAPVAMTVGALISLCGAIYGAQVWRRLRRRSLEGIAPDGARLVGDD